jgi:Protein of unknown function (DUF3945)/Protein of unknown function (DUF4099)
MKIIPVENLPFEQFRLLGMEKKAVLSLPQETLQALQSGNRTSLIQFKNLQLNGDTEPVTVNAKLSIETQSDGKLNLKMHPINLAPKNTMGLKESEMVYLQQNPLYIIPKVVVSKTGEAIDSFVTFDHTTNEFTAVRKNTIKAPDAINEVKLTAQQKKDFVNGRQIQLGKENFQLDVNTETGVTGSKINSISFKSGKYTPKNILLDFAIIAAGLAPIVLVEHLAKMLVRNVAGNLYDNRKQLHELLNKDLSIPVKNTLATIAEKTKQGISFTPKEKNELLVFNVVASLKQDEHLSNTIPVPKNLITENVSIIPEQKSGVSIPATTITPTENRRGIGL